MSLAGFLVLMAWIAAIVAVFVRREPLAVLLLSAAVVALGAALVVGDLVRYG